MSNPIPEAPDPVLSTMETSGRRRWIYPVPSRGRFWRARLAIGWALILIFVSLPWVEIGGRPAVFLDIARREFIFFGLYLHATDMVVLMAFLLTVLLAVFFVTALFGRLWCGWGCPQTVYLEFVFRPIERLIEGKETRRRRRDEGPWTLDKIWRKGLKWAVFAVLSLFLAHTFVAYFAGWERLLSWMGSSPAHAPGYFAMMAITTGLILFDFANFREQMCTLVCPYARLQSVLMDDDSLIVSYDRNRGEKRGTYRDRKLGTDALDLDGEQVRFGDCIDCGCCVRTCPTGIDIRDGLQMECISCTQCVDACDAVMDAIDKPRGLIRYTSENAIDEKPTTITRPRVLMYGLLLLLCGSVLVGLIVDRPDLELDVRRAAGTTYSITADDRVANRLSFRLRNRTGQEATVGLAISEPDGAYLKVIGEESITLPPGELKRTEAWITVPASQMPPGGTDAIIEVTVDGGVVQTIEFRLLGPTNNGSQS